MSTVLESKVRQAISARAEWEERQLVWRQMRKDGLRRRRKPWPGANDLHFPLISTQIEKLKPFYYGQAFSQDRLARFVSLQEQLGEMTEAAADYLDYLLKNETNFEEELPFAIDTMLVSGRGLMKVRWDFQTEAIEFESIDPLFLIVPPGTVTLEKAPWFCHVKHMSVDEFKACGLYKVNDDLLQRIRGGDKETNQAVQEKAEREGITRSNDENIIVLWEVWQKIDKGRIVHTFSPGAPSEPVRQPFLYNVNFRGKTVEPFVSWQFEKCERGWYAPRGVAEHQAPHEAYICKVWNGKADAMDFLNKPLFGSQGQVRNVGNVRFQPGEVLPDGVSPLTMPPPPLSFDQELMQTHRIAQESLSMPDANITTLDKSKRENPTATEIEYRSGLASQGIEMRGRLFREGLAKLYFLSWALVLKHKQSDAVYFVADNLKRLPQQSMHELYLIVPDGTADNWHRGMRFQRALQRYQTLGGNPFINQEELAKATVADDDPRLVKTLVLPQNAHAANEAEDEAIEIMLLQDGFPAQVKPGEDHALRIKVLSGKLQELMMRGTPVDPVAKQRIQQHFAMHVQFLMQQNPTLARQIVAAVQDMDPTGQPAMQQPMPQPEPETMTETAMP